MGVELVGVNRTEGPAEFELAWSAWDGVRELAQTHGWAPGRPGWRCKRSPEDEAEDEAREASWRAELAELEALGEPSQEERWERNQLRFLLDPYHAVDYTYGFRHMRVVSTEDARAMAEALARALAKVPASAGSGKEKPRGYLIVEGLDGAAHARMNGGLDQGFLRGFIAFLEGGAFCVAAWD